MEDHNVDAAQCRQDAHSQSNFLHVTPYASLSDELNRPPCPLLMQLSIPNLG